MPESTTPRYVTVSRGQSAAVFSDGDEWTVRAFPAGTSRVDITFRTAYASYGFEAPVPRWLYGEVSGVAESLEDAIRRFPNAARTLTPIFDVALNASVEDLDLHLGFDGTRGREERKFFQNFARESILTLRQFRPVRTSFLSHLAEAIALHPDTVRIHRAAAHYQQALRFWSFGDETRAVGNLWMGFEALTPVVTRQEMRRTGTTTSRELASALNVELKELDATLRQSVLFDGDKKAYRITKEASDGFEHGFIPLDQLRTLARDTKDNSAAHLRRSIIRLCAMPDPICSEMLRAPYTTPIIGFPFTKYLRGTLRGSGDLAPPGRRYPSVAWRTDIEHFRLRDGGGHDVQWNEKVTAQLGPAIELTDVSIELWSGEKAPPGTVRTQDFVVVREDTGYRDPTTQAEFRRPLSWWRAAIERLLKLVGI